jgi:group I intron endonuclease
MQRGEMFKELKAKSGIYCWVNMINGKYYIGSGIDLNNRINDYFQESYYKSKSDLIIVRAILKYGLGNFALVILEFTDKDELLSREQHFLDTLEPEYNTLDVAGNSQGYNHTPESIAKMTKLALGRNHSDEVRKAMSENRMGENNPFFGKNHSEETIAKLKEIALNRDKDHNPGFVLEVLDLENNLTMEYKSIREAALDTNLSTLVSRNKRGTIKPYKGRYIINIKRP